MTVSIEKKVAESHASAKSLKNKSPLEVSEEGGKGARISTSNIFLLWKAKTTVMRAGSARRFEIMTFENLLLNVIKKRGQNKIDDGPTDSKPSYSERRAKNRRLHTVPCTQERRAKNRRLHTVP